MDARVFDAIVDCVRTALFEEGAEPFCGWEISDKTRAEVIAYLRPECTAFDLLLLCETGHEETSNAFLIGVLQSMTQTSRKVLIESWLTMPKDEWEHTEFSVAQLMAVLMHCGLVSTADFRRWRAKAEELRQTFTKFESFWSYRIRQDIAKRDWVRAWDDLRHALIGFPEDEKHTLYQLQNWSERRSRSWLFDGRLFYCKGAVRDQLVHEVFDFMVEAGILSPITPDDCFIRQHRISVTTTRFSSRESEPVTFDCRAPVPGILEALTYATQYDVWPIPLETEGAMVLKIADYAQKEKNAKRNRRNAKKRRALEGKAKE